MDELVAQQKFQDWTEMEGFLDAQYDSRLASILKGKSSSIDALDFGMKDKITRQNHNKKKTTLCPLGASISKRGNLVF
jgi:hypothetical protein